MDENNNEVGKITSSVYSIRFGRHIGLAYIKKSFIDEGTKLVAKSVTGKIVNVTVKDLPFKK